MLILFSTMNWNFIEATLFIEHFAVHLSIWSSASTLKTSSYYYTLYIFCVECDNNTYGPGCRLRCQCSNGAVCNHATGRCTCTAGWRGDHCDRPCPAGQFGHNCRSKCSCDNGARCDHVTGECSCAAGWTGRGCLRPCRPGTWGPGCNQVGGKCQLWNAGMKMSAIKSY